MDSFYAAALSGGAWYAAAQPKDGAAGKEEQRLLEATLVLERTVIGQAIALSEISSMIEEERLTRQADSDRLRSEIAVLTKRASARSADKDAEIVRLKAQLELEDKERQSNGPVMNELRRELKLASEVAPHLVLHSAVIAIRESRGIGLEPKDRRSKARAGSKRAARRKR